MSRAISFQNEGLIDLRAVKTFGASSKRGDNPIGFFGTGLKYAIAIALREGCRVELFRGLERYEFTSEETRIRDHDFSLVKMNDEELAFTTELGKTWETWQAFRELYCNTTDEGGSIAAGEIPPSEDHTTVVVHGEPFLNAYYERGSIILQTEPLHELKGAEIHLGQSGYLFYRGIRVYKLDQQSQFTYNILENMDLTEDRTVKNEYQHRRILADAILTAESTEVIEDFVLAHPDSFEAHFCLSSGISNPGEMFMQYFGEQASFRNLTNVSARSIYERVAKRSMKPKGSVLNEVEAQQLALSYELCVLVGLENVKDYNVTVTTDLPNNVLGLAKDGEIFISKRAFMMGTKMVAGTLMEEYLHVHHDLDDESRELQNYLFDLVITMGERVQGRPL